MGTAKERVKVSDGAKCERYSLEFKREALRLLELGEQNGVYSAGTFPVATNDVIDPSRSGCYQNVFDTGGVAGAPAFGDFETGVGVYSKIQSE